MIRLLNIGLTVLGIWGIACGSTQVAAPTKSPDTSVTVANQNEEVREGAPEYKNTLKWSTASEVDNFGFDIYRAESEDGPFVRLNDTPVPGAGTVDLPTYYEYVDDTIAPDSEYFYYIESISIGGVREKFTPTYRAAPKNAQGDPEGQD